MGTSTRHSRQRHWGRVAIAVVLLFLAFLIAGFLGALVSALRSMHTEVTGTDVRPPGARINVLLLGVDSGLTNEQGKVGRARSDTVILVSYDPDAQEVGVLWIPRDTRVEIPGRPHPEKIAHAHAYGGPALAMQTVAAFLEVPVHYYVRITFEGFVKLVDLLGGVEVEVKERMYYEDPTQNLVIDLQPGRQVLDGEKALQFVRYRGYPTSDIGRIAAEQEFIRAALRKALSPWMVVRSTSLLREAAKHVDTNMEWSTILSLARAAAGLRWENIRMDTLPGKSVYISDGNGPRLSYWVVDREATQKLVDELIRGIDRQANAQVKVEIVNASGNGELGTQVAQYLESLGFTVVKVRQSGAVSANSMVIGRRGNGQAAKLVAKALTQVRGPMPVRTEADSVHGVDVTVVVGKDYSDQ